MVLSLSELQKLAQEVKLFLTCKLTINFFHNRYEIISTKYGYCLKWLYSKKPHLVVYICFGSVGDFNDSQLMQIAMGLEASGPQFILGVVKKENKDGEKEERLLLEGFEKENGR